MTSDIWTDSDQKSYMAITAHLTLLKDDGLDYLSRLIAFRPMPMSHTGKNMAAEFIHILKDYGILNKVIGFTLLCNWRLCFCRSVGLLWTMRAITIQ